MLSVGDWGSASVDAVRVVAMSTGVVVVVLGGVSHSAEWKLLLGVVAVVSIHVGVVVGIHIGGWYGLPVAVIAVKVVGLVTLQSLLL